jgi:hypothetical protein
VPRNAKPSYDGFDRLILGNKYDHPSESKKVKKFD